MHPRFPEKPWEIMKIHGSALIFNEILSKIYEQQWISMISQGVLGNLGLDLIHPPKFCAGLALRPGQHERGLRAHTWRQAARFALGSRPGLTPEECVRWAVELGGDGSAARRACGYATFMAQQECLVLCTLYFGRFGCVHCVSSVQVGFMAFQNRKACTPDWSGVGPAQVCAD